MKKLLSIALLMTMVAASPVLCMEPDENNNNEDKKKISFFKKIKDKVGQKALSFVEDKSKKLNNWVLLEAVKAQDFKKVIEILDSAYYHQFGDVNHQDENKRTPLFWAVHLGNLEIVQLLIKHKANPDIKGLEKGTPFFDGEITPFHLAIYYNKTEIAQFLIENGADIHAVDSNLNATPLLWAIGKNNFNIIPCLLKRCIKPPYQSNAWPKVKPLLVGLHDKNSLLSTLPKNLLENILFYAPDCINSKKMFGSAIIAHCGEYTIEAVEQFISEHRIDEIKEMRKLLEHQSKDGDNAFALFNNCMAVTSAEGQDMKPFFQKILDPAHVEETYTDLFIELFVPQEEERPAEDKKDSAGIETMADRSTDVKTMTGKEAKEESKE